MSKRGTGGGAAVAFLGPEGTFTHQAALDWLARAGTRAPSGATVPMETVRQVHDAVASGTAARGVVAIENSIEGYVVPSVDALLGSADVVAVDAVALDISFDAFVRPSHGKLKQAVAHPHGLAQVAEFVAGRGLTPLPASSNAAACRDLGPNGVAFGPRLCGSLYGLQTYARGVEDFQGARTRFLVLARRDEAPDDFAQTRAAIDRAIRRELALAKIAPARGRGRGLLRKLGRRPAPLPLPDVGDGFSCLTGWRTLLAITPVATGPGVLARVTESFGNHQVNMSSLITRPLKVRAEQYVFVATLDGAPWDDTVRGLLGELMAAGDYLKVIGAYPTHPDEGALDGVLADHIPDASVTAKTPDKTQTRSLLW
ncbi:MAG: prephenate dehydratase [Promicromonosporaceae bacterium]|nr:prephenate dehydratase [Promicromonosporaceae bacterium]